MLQSIFDRRNLGPAGYVTAYQFLVFMSEMKEMDYQLKKELLNHGVEFSSVQKIR